MNIECGRRNRFLDGISLEIVNVPGEAVGSAVGLSTFGPLLPGDRLVVAPPTLLPLIPFGVISVPKSPGFAGFLPK